MSEEDESLPSNVAPHDSLYTSRSQEFHRTPQLPALVRENPADYRLPAGGNRCTLLIPESYSSPRDEAPREALYPNGHEEGLHRPPHKLNMKPVTPESLEELSRLILPALCLEECLETPGAYSRGLPPRSRRSRRPGVRPQPLFDGAQLLSSRSSGVGRGTHDLTYLYKL